MPLKEFFVETGLTGLLESSHLDKVEQVPPTLGSVVDLLCENKDNGEVTTVFTLFVDVFSSLFRRRAESFWTI